MNNHLEKCSKETCNPRLLDMGGCANCGKEYIVKCSCGRATETGLLVDSAVDEWNVSLRNAKRKGNVQ